MNWIDILLIIIVLISIVNGWQNGFISGTLYLVTWIGSLLAGFLFYQYVAGLLEKIVPSLGVWTLPVAFILTLIIARLLLSFIVNGLLAGISNRAHHHDANRFLGIIPGFVNGLIWSAIIAALLYALPFADGLSAETRKSKIANKMADQVEWLDEKLSPVFDEAIKKTINKLTVNPESKKSVKLPFAVANPKVREDLESDMLVMINEERQKAGLPAFKADPELAIVARKHSKDMFVRSYFSHITPEGKTPTDRIREGHVRFLTAGENLALGQTLSICHNGLMNSQGHRANILHKAYGRVGIGILDGGMYGLMVTQNFRN